VLKKCKFLDNEKIFSKFVMLKNSNSFNLKSMIKKILLFTSLFFTGVMFINAQCTPDGSAVDPGIYPDTATNLSYAYATIPYYETMTAVIPKDTFYQGFTLQIDSIGITSITGLPAGFIYTPNSASGYWPGWPDGSSGCILISGTATQAQVGTYPLIINTKAYASLGGLSQTQTDAVTGYKIIIKDTALGIDEYNQDAISFITYPNLNDNSIIAKIHSNSVLNDAVIIINDITGRESMRLNNLNGTDFIISNRNLSNGVYIISIINNEKIIARKKVIF
jgi:hypothetical protein